MSRRAKFDTPQAQARRIKEGRGQGEGPNYKPWLRVKDVKSRGRRHRTFSVKFGRTLHLMSDLEDKTKSQAEWRDDVVDLREQVPLFPLSETQAIAKAFGYRHPRPPGAKHDIIMTTDQVWLIQTGAGRFYQPISVKYRKDIDDPRVEQKNEIEAEYWRRRPRTLPLDYCDEASATKNFVRNWRLIRSTLRPAFFKYFSANLVSRVDRCLRRTVERGTRTMSELAGLAAVKLGVPKGEVRSAIHNLIATKRWPVDLDAARLQPTLVLKLQRSTHR